VASNSQTSQVIGDPKMTNKEPFPVGIPINSTDYFVVPVNKYSERLSILSFGLAIVECD
jgi:hypothetical protein